MSTQSNIQPMNHAGHACLQLTTRHGTAIVALHGAQILSWHPKGHRDVFWLSTLSEPAPAAIRGGVPVCWPWFGKQGMPQGGMQHGPVRNRPWDVISVQDDSAEVISLTLAPCRATTPDDPLARFARQLQLTMRIDLQETLTQTLETRNSGMQPFVLTCITSTNSPHPNNKHSRSSKGPSPCTRTVIASINSTPHHPPTATR
jgi:glucose-6-phosphate 1-epimerase